MRLENWRSVLGSRTWNTENEHRFCFLESIYFEKMGSDGDLPFVNRVRLVNALCLDGNSDSTVGTFCQTLRIQYDNGLFLHPDVPFGLQCFHGSAEHIAYCS